MRGIFRVVWASARSVRMASRRFRPEFAPAATSAVGTAFGLTHGMQQLQGSAPVLEMGASRYRSVLEACHDEVFVVDRTNRFEYANARAVAALSPRSPFVGQRVADCFPAPVGPNLEREIDRAREAATPMYSECRIQFPSGPRWMSTWLAPIDDGEGGTTSVMGVARDITAQHELGEALTRHHHLLNRLVEASPAGVLLVSRLEKKWVCEFSNPVACRLAGNRELDGAPIEDTWPDLAASVAHLLDVLAGSDRDETVEAAVTTHADCGVATRYLSVTASRLHLPDHAEWSALLLISDITDRRELEQQLLQTDKMDAVGRLAGGIAHDFNNLLTPILGYTEIVLGTLAEGDPRRRDLEEVCCAAKSASGLTRQLLTFSRKQPTCSSPLDLNSVLQNVEGLVRRTIGEDVRVTFDFAANPATTVADRNQIEQVVMNLCVNARDAMPEGGVLTIQTANLSVAGDRDASHAMPPGSYVALRIADTGSGIPPEVQTHIFDPFFTTKAIGKGTGLGLSIVHGIVTQSGGYIEVASAPERGTSFTLYFPTADPAVMAHPPSADMADATACGGGETVLVVEDNEGLRRLAERLLRADGYSPLLAPNGAEALALSRAFDGPIHLMLTDIVMPDIDGVTLACQIASERPCTRVLFMSGYTGHDAATHGLLSGDLPLLQKPFTHNSLRRALRDALDRPWDGEITHALAASGAGQGNAGASASRGAMNLSSAEPAEKASVWRGSTSARPGSIR